VIVDPTAPVASWNNGSAWRPSSRLGGSPSATDPLRGDLNIDHRVDAGDIDAIFAELRNGAADLNFDLNYDGSVNPADVAELVEEILDTFFGDANLDRQVDGADVDRVTGRLFTSGAGWADGDFNGDTHVDAADFNIWQRNRFRQATPSRAAVRIAQRVVPRAAARSTVTTPLRNDTMRENVLRRTNG
jgi:hypothetical protein